MNIILFIYLFFFKTLLLKFVEFFFKLNTYLYFQFALLKFLTNNNKNSHTRGDFVFV